MKKKSLQFISHDFIIQYSAKCCTSNHPQGSNSDGKLFGLLLQAHRPLGLGDDVSSPVVEKPAFMENIWKKKQVKFSRSIEAIEHQRLTVEVQLHKKSYH